MSRRGTVAYSKVRFRRLGDWLDWQQRLHPNAIDLGLDRVRAVADRLGVLSPAVPVFTVAGTNGKGSCVAYLDAALRSGGYRTGTYTSPHLLRYNERIRIDGVEIDDQSLVEAFERVDHARGDISLTYFEFGTLAAFELFRQHRADAWVLEVGLGGRLDAVNVIDADCAVVTSIGLDHTDWLGTDRDAIGREKAGVFRSQRPAVYGERDVPAGVLEAAAACGADLVVAGRDYRIERYADNWSLEDRHGRLEGLPPPGLPGRVQFDNAAAALVALRALSGRLPLEDDALRTGIADARLSGRLETIPGQVEWVLDVAHNRESVEHVSEYLEQREPRRTLAVFAQMRRKALKEVVAAIEGRVDTWFLLQLPDADARPAREVAALLSDRGATVALQAEGEELWSAVTQAARPGDRVLVFGSFRTVEEAKRYMAGAEVTGRGM